MYKGRQHALLFVQYSYCTYFSSSRLLFKKVFFVSVFLLCTFCFIFVLFFFFLIMWVVEEEKISSTLEVLLAV